jgi:hypothetical protein
MQSSAAQAQRRCALMVTTECVATNLFLGVCLSNGRRFDEGTIDRYIYCSQRMQNCRCAGWELISCQF